MHIKVLNKEMLVFIVAVVIFLFFNPPEDTCIDLRERERREGGREERGWGKKERERERERTTDVREKH